MQVDHYLSIMEFHPKWREHGMLPAELIDQLCTTYRPGMEAASEHDRNGVFHWWLRRAPSKEVLMRLVELSFLDPDQIMAEDVRSHIAQSPSYDKDVERRIVEGRLARSDG